MSINTHAMNSARHYLLQCVGQGSVALLLCVAAPSTSYRARSHCRFALPRTRCWPRSVRNLSLSFSYKDGRCLEKRRGGRTHSRSFIIVVDDH
jgi:hypothetical protein